MLKKIKVRRECTVLGPLTLPSTKRSDGTEKFTTTGSVDDCSVLPETQFVGTLLRMNTTQLLSAWVPFPYGSCSRQARVRHQAALRDTTTPNLASGLSPEAFSARK